MSLRILEQSLYPTKSSTTTKTTLEPTYTISKEVLPDKTTLVSETTVTPLPTKTTYTEPTKTVLAPSTSFTTPTVSPTTSPIMPSELVAVEKTLLPEPTYVQAVTKETIYGANNTFQPSFDVVKTEQVETAALPSGLTEPTSDDTPDLCERIRRAMQALLAIGDRAGAVTLEREIRSLTTLPGRVSAGEEKSTTTTSTSGRKKRSYWPLLVAAGLATAGYLLLRDEEKRKAA